jgi:hypothetical protein
MIGDINKVIGLLLVCMCFEISCDPPLKKAPDYEASFDYHVSPETDTISIKSRDTLWIAMDFPGSFINRNSNNGQSISFRDLSIKFPITVSRVQTGVPDFVNVYFTFKIVSGDISFIEDCYYVTPFYNGAQDLYTIKFGLVPTLPGCYFIDSSEALGTASIEAKTERIGVFLYSNNINLHDYMPAAGGIDLSNYIASSRRLGKGLYFFSVK